MVSKISSIASSPSEDVTSGAQFAIRFRTGTRAGTCTSTKQGPASNCCLVRCQVRSASRVGDPEILLSQRLSDSREIDINWSGANRYQMVCAISVRPRRRIDLDSRTRGRRRLQIPSLRPPQCQARFGVRVPGSVQGHTALIRYIRYFIHDKHAGISAFVNVPADESQRNAQMLAVGVLVPLTYGRLGKSWRHAEGLQELAKYDMKILGVTVWLIPCLQRAHFQRGPSTHAGGVLGKEPHSG